MNYFYERVNFVELDLLLVVAGSYAIYESIDAIVWRIALALDGGLLLFLIAFGDMRYFDYLVGFLRLIYKGLLNLYYLGLIILLLFSLYILSFYFSILLNT